MEHRRSYHRPLAKLKGLLSHTSPAPKITLADASKTSIDPFLYAEAIIEALHDPIVILDKNLTIRVANKAFFKTFKLTKKQTLGRNLPSLDDDNPHIKELTKRLRNLNKQNTSFEEFELTYTFTRIGEKTMLINAKRIHLGRRITEFTLLSIEDITKRRRLEQQKDDFVGFVTHEIKTPITSVLAFVQILQGYHAKTGDKRSQFLLQRIASQVARLTTLLNSFANVYKAQTGNIELHKKQFDMNHVVRDVVETFQYMSSTHDLIVEGKITHPAFGDRDRIHEVLTNLVNNAVKYSPAAEKIIIKLEESPKEITVHVRDFGIGITPEEQEKVFDRFFRVKGKTQNKIEGLGLGLYIVAAIIKQHKGKIWVKSTEGKGATFSFTLPVKV